MELILVCFLYILKCVLKNPKVKKEIRCQFILLINALYILFQSSEQSFISEKEHMLVKSNLKMTFL